MRFAKYLSDNSCSGDVKICGVILIISFFIFAWSRETYVFISVPSAGNPACCYISPRILGLKVVTDYRDEGEELLISNSKPKLSRQILIANLRPNLIAQKLKQVIMTYAASSKK